MGHSCFFQSTGVTFYISYNHSEFSRIWHVSRAHGHLGKTIAKDLLKALDHPELRNICAWDGKDKSMDCWTIDLRVFKYILQELLCLCVKNMDKRFFSDSVKKEDITKVEDSDGDGEDYDGY